MEPFLVIFGHVSVYVLHSPTFDKIYIDFTSDLENRFLSHNQLSTKGHTVKYRPWLIAHTEQFETKQAAKKRETQLKSSNGRAFLWKIIKEKFNSSNG